MSASATLIVSTPLRFGTDAVKDEHDLLAAGSGRCGEWVWAHITRIGKRHSAVGGVCEDAAGVRVGEVALRGGIHLALADGVSGGARGDIAAAALVRHCLHWSPEHSITLSSWIGDAADIAVRRALAASTPEPGAATLAAAWLGPDGSGTLSRIGDCRAYVWQAPVYVGDTLQVRQLLPDQTMAYMGYASPLSPKACQPAHMVGNRSTGTPELLPISVPPGSGLLLCSDGLHDVIDVAGLARQLAALFAESSLISAPSQFESVCHNLIEHAQELGSDDDVSVLLVARTLPLAKKTQCKSDGD